MGPSDQNHASHYHNAISDIHRELRRPHTQRKVFSLTQTTPTDLVRSKLSTSEIQSRALSSLPDGLLDNIPEDTSSYSLFQGFQASLPEDEREARRAHRRRSSKASKLLKDSEKGGSLSAGPIALKDEREKLSRRLELMGVRKNMCSAEIHEIDHKIANLNNMRKIVLDRLAGLERDEADLEAERGLFPFFDKRCIPDSNGTVTEIDNKLEDVTPEPSVSAGEATPKISEGLDDSSTSGDPAMDASFMSESIYEKLPSPRNLRHRSISKDLVAYG